MSEKESDQPAQYKKAENHRDKNSALANEDKGNQKPEAMEDHGNQENQEPKTKNGLGNQENQEHEKKNGLGNHENQEHEKKNGHGNQENQEHEEKNGHGNQDNKEPKEPKYQDNQENKEPEQREEQNNGEYQAIVLQFNSIVDNLPHVRQINMLLACVKRLCELVPPYLRGADDGCGDDGCGDDGCGDGGAFGLKRSLFVCLKEYLRRHDCEELQHETIRALLLLFTEKTAPILWKYIILTNIIPLFVELLNLKKLWLPAMAALPILIGSNPECRKQALSAGILEALYFVRVHIPLGSLTVAKCLSYLSQDIVGHSLALNMLNHLIRQKQERVISATCVAILGYIGDGDVRALRSLVCHGIARLLFQLVAHESYDIASTSLTIVEKMSTTPATPRILNASLVQGLLPALLPALSSDSTMRHATCLTLRHVTQFPENAPAVIETRIVPALLRVLGSDINGELESEIMEEACRGICNTLIHSNAIDMCQVIGQPLCADYIVELLAMGNVLLKDLALEAIKSSLQKSRSLSRAMQSSVAETLHDSGDIFQHLRELLNHHNDDIKRKANSVLKTMSRLVCEHKES